jgi:hypothetical protein
MLDRLFRRDDAAAIAAPGLPQINHNKYASVVTDLEKARADKQASDALSRDADKRIKGARNTLLNAMDGNPVVGCGPSTVLTFKPGKAIAASITLLDGRSVPLAEIGGIVVGGEIIAPDRIKTLFGGRCGADDVEISNN